MTKEEIKKALLIHISEDMNCEDCPYYETDTEVDYDCGTCHSVDFDDDVFNLVNEQEIERLKDENKQAKIEVLEELKKERTTVYINDSEVDEAVFVNENNKHLDRYKQQSLFDFI